MIVYLKFMYFCLKIFSLSSYSFTYHPIEKLHDTIPEIIPGIEKVVTVHYDASRKLIFGILTEKGNKGYTTKSLNIETSLPILQRYMEEKNRYDWYARSNLPFEIDVKEKNPKITIFSELQNIVLLVRIPDETNTLNDLVFLYLNENPSNFGVTNSINPLTTDNKSIIAFLMHNTLRTIVELQRNDRKALATNNSRTRHVIDRAESLRYETRRTNENYGLSLVKLCQQYLRNFSEKYRKKYTLSAAALDKIKSYKGDLKDLENIIEESVSYINSLYLDGTEDIEVLEWHMQFTNPIQQDKSQEIPEKYYDKYAKAASVLDKLENAALVAISQHLKLTGTNVGKSCPVPISAPAISDILYNHKSKINSLLKLYPDKWETIRNNFRPLMNVMKDNKN